MTDKTNEQVIAILNKHYKNDVILKLKCLGACQKGIELAIKNKRKTFKQMWDNTEYSGHMEWLLFKFLQLSHIKEDSSYDDISWYADKEFRETLFIYYMDEGKFIKKMFNIVGDPTPSWEQVVFYSKSYNGDVFGVIKNIRESMNSINLIYNRYVMHERSNDHYKEKDFFRFHYDNKI